MILIKRNTENTVVVTLKEKQVDINNQNFLINIINDFNYSEYNIILPTQLSPYMRYDYFILPNNNTISTLEEGTYSYIIYNNINDINTNSTVSGLVELEKGRMIVKD